MSDIIIYQTADNQTAVEVRFEEETVWLTQTQIVELFHSSKANISEHLKSIFASNELVREATVRKFRTVRTEGKREVERELEHFNLDVIISIGYRVNTKRGIQFRQWAAQRLKEYLVQGYAINENRLKQKQQEIEYLKTGIRILSRAIEEQADDNETLKHKAKYRFKTCKSDLALPGCNAMTGIETMLDIHTRYLHFRAKAAGSQRTDQSSQPLFVNRSGSEVSDDYYRQFYSELGKEQAYTCLPTNSVIQPAA